MIREPFIVHKHTVHDQQCSDPVMKKLQSFMHALDFRRGAHLAGGGVWGPTPPSIALIFLGWVDGNGRSSDVLHRFEPKIKKESHPTCVHFFMPFHIFHSCKHESRLARAADVVQHVITSFICFFDLFVFMKPNM